MRPVYGQVEEQRHDFFRINRKMNYRAEFLWHFHHVFELNLIIKGEGTRFVGDSIAHYRNGDLVLMAPEMPHTWHGQGRHQSVGIQFADTFLGPAALHNPEWRHVGSLFERARRGLHFQGRTRRVVAQKVEELEQLNGPQKLIGLLAVLDLLALSRESRPLCSRDFVPALKTDAERRVDKVCNYVAANIAGSVTQPEAARVAGMSRSAFSLFFKRTLGRTFTDYVGELRVGRACQLLIETDDSVAAIAYHVGFNNLSNFNRRFLRLKNVSPLNYRKQYRDRRAD